MKTLFLTLGLALMLMCGSALRCNYCVPYSGGSRCTTTTKTCGYNEDTCVSAMFTIYPFTYFRRCISWSDCMILQSSAYIQARCCQRDLCN